MLPRLFSRKNRFYLSVSETEKRIRLKDEFILGRASHAVFAEDKRISARHCQFHIDGDLLRVADLKSTNGTFVNQEKLVPGESRRLKDGDVVSVGNSTFVVVIEGGETNEEAELSPEERPTLPEANPLPPGLNAPSPAQVNSEELNFVSEEPVALSWIQKLKVLVLVLLSMGLFATAMGAIAKFVQGERNAFNLVGLVLFNLLALLCLWQARRILQSPYSDEFIEEAPLDEPPAEASLPSEELE